MTCSLEMHATPGAPSRIIGECQQPYESVTAGHESTVYTTLTATDPLANTVGAMVPLSACAGAASNKTASTMPSTVWPGARMRHAQLAPAAAAMLLPSTDA